MVTCPFCGDFSCDMIHTLDEDASKIVGFPYQVPFGIPTQGESSTLPALKDPLGHTHSRKGAICDGH